MSRLRVGKRLRRVTSGKLIQTDQCHIPHRMTPCSALKAQRKEKEGQMVVVMVFVFPSKPYKCWGPAAQVVARHLPADGKRWVNSSFALLVCATFALPIKLPLPRSSRLLAILLFSPSHRKGNKMLSGFGCWPQQTHYKANKITLKVYLNKNHFTNLQTLLQRYLDRYIIHTYIHPRSLLWTESCSNLQEPVGFIRNTYGPHRKLGAVWKHQIAELQSCSPTGS